MKNTKLVVIILAFVVAFGIGYDTVGANQNLIAKGVDLSWYLRYVFFFPGATMCAYLFASLTAARRWGHIAAATLLVLPILVTIHFIVSVMNAHTGLVYWIIQVIEVALTYLAWAFTGKRWKATRSAPSPRST